MIVDILAIHKKLKTKEISPVDLTQECLNKAKTSHHNCFISLVEDFALRAAEAAQERLQKEGPKTYLDGIPFNLKDLFITKGIRTTAGSMILYNYIPPYDGYVAEKLKSAGGILMGKVGCDEFGMGSTNENTPFGPVTNPINPGFVAGGSSGGSAASIVEGSSFYSIGTDTGGSIRLPANFCGLVGLRPTYGRISRYGQIAYASSLDQSSPIGRSVSDMACILEDLTEHDSRDSTNIPLGRMEMVEEVSNTKVEYLKGKKIGVNYEFIEACDPLVKTSLKKAIEQFKTGGSEFIEVDLEHFKYSVSAYYIVATSEASSNLARFDGIHYGFRDSCEGGAEQIYRSSRSKGLGNEVKKRILLGTYSLSSGYYNAYYKKACQVRRLIHNDFQQAFKVCDVILSPVCASTAFPLGKSGKDPIKTYVSDLYTIPINLAGLPGLALPFGKGENGLPTGFQLIGEAFGEKKLLQMGRAFELFDEESL